MHLNYFFKTIKTLNKLDGADINQVELSDAELSAISEDNFYEMRDATADPIFNKKRQIELRLEAEHPEYYSKYSLVTFKAEIPYHMAMKQGRLQNKILYEIAKKTDNPDTADLQQILKEVNEYLSENMN